MHWVFFISLCFSQCTDNRDFIFYPVLFHVSRVCRCSGRRGELLLPKLARIHDTPVPSVTFLWFISIHSLSVLFLWDGNDLSFSVWNVSKLRARMHLHLEATLIILVTRGQRAYYRIIKLARGIRWQIFNRYGETLKWCLWEWSCRAGYAKRLCKRWKSQRSFSARFPELIHVCLEPLMVFFIFLCKPTTMKISLMFSRKLLSLQKQTRSLSNGSRLRRSSDSFHGLHYDFSTRGKANTSGHSLRLLTATYRVRREPLCEREPRPATEWLSRHGDGGRPQPPAPCMVMKYFVRRAGWRAVTSHSMAHWPAADDSKCTVAVIIPRTKPNHRREEGVNLWGNFWSLLLNVSLDELNQRQNRLKSLRLQI